MAITINGTGTITGASTLATTVASPTFTTPNINSAQFATVSGTAPIYACRAWVNFNGTGTVAIRASGNVSSITDNGTGEYTVNFTTAMPDVNYCFQISAQDANNGMGVPTAQADPTRAITTSALPVIYNYPPDTAFYDAPVFTVAVFR
jgi:hypothetical protein